MLTPVWEVEPGGEGPLHAHVNATATGGGVSELLRGLLRQQPAGWAVIAGNAKFYAVTKYLHHLLHGQSDPARLDDPELMRTYRATLEPQQVWFKERVVQGDVVVLHDPQTLGLAPAIKAAGGRTVWHCHIGAVIEPERGPGAMWRAFGPELEAVDAVVTTLPEFAPPSAHQLFLIPPAIDLEAVKNRELGPDEIAAVLAEIGLTSGREASDVVVVQERPLPPGARVVLQVSRWDPLKDMPGVARCVVGLPSDVHVVLAGTNPLEIPDDPEGLAVLAEVRAVLAELSEVDRSRVHLVNISMKQQDRNALVVNALQRRADVVMQKSLQEGFGLTVTEAMVKAKAVVASDVGGLRQQITHGHNGILVDPADLDDVRAQLCRLLDDPALRREFGDRARATVVERYTMPQFADAYRKVSEVLS
ncbi:glycosyltransferase [Kutzneria sp. CA-103260]|uniref:glycosyltransferase n=1 Tax=Kutzneria sp. CA-103260 TaxID=2802641 RepID=UPI001BA5365D|nr:glycosyltransferase [Kutzneria sp. CA-103260]QUQ64992.1 Trehalose synthase [Kutzneria sp. CA-103260]